MREAQEFSTIINNIKTVLGTDGERKAPKYSDPIAEVNS